MEQINVDPDGVRIFIPENPEVASYRNRNDIYQKHLKQVRKIIVFGLVGFLAVCWLFSQNGRYQPASTEGSLVIDTRNGIVFDYKGNWIGQNEWKPRFVKIHRIEMGFWPYFGFWKVKSEDK